MKEQIFGHFYLKMTSNGNLLGEFSNETTIGIFSESADLQTIRTNTFIGTYLSTWIENRDSLIFELTISIKKEESTHLKYDLSWRNLNNENLTFIGEGFIVDDILIGHYRTL